MQSSYRWIPWLVLVGFFLFGLGLSRAAAQAVDRESAPGVAAPQGMVPKAAAQAVPVLALDEAALQGSQPFFRYPVVPGSTISGHFDHNQGNDLVTFYDGRHNQSVNHGFFFSCPEVGMYDFVGCQDSVSGEGGCSNDRELWYDGHKGTDYEYSANWYTGAVCDTARFKGVVMPVYAPAKGKVLMAGYDPSRPANGWHIRLMHDLNGNGNFNDDNFRSVYLHFTAYALAVTPGQIVSEGQYLGLGGSTGYSSSPHLHFEVQRSSDYFQTNYWSVDPYGWQGPGADPWPYLNVVLWRVETPPTPTPSPTSTPANMNYKMNLPVAMREEDFGCPFCKSLLQNGDFESGHQAWVENGVDVITSTSHPKLPVIPYSGNWLAWLGGRSNAEDGLSQSFTFPQGFTSLNLSYVFRLNTAETGGAADWMTVRLRDGNGNLIRELDGMDNTFAAPGQWVQRAMTVADLGAWAGQTLELSFEAHTNSAAVTNFYLDEVSLQGK